MSSVNFEEYCEESLLSHEVYICRVDGRCGVYNFETSTLLIPLVYDKIAYNNDRLLCAREDSFDLFEVDNEFTRTELLKKNVSYKFYFPYGVGHNIRQMMFVSGPLVPLSSNLVCIPAYLEGDHMIKPFLKDDEIDVLLRLAPTLFKRFNINLNVEQHIEDEFGRTHAIDIAPIRYGVYEILSDNTLRMVLPHKYDEVRLRDDGNLDVRVVNRWGIASVQVGEMTPIKYFEPVHSQLVQDAESMLYGYLSKDFTKELLSTNFQSILFPTITDQGYTWQDLSSKPIAVGKCGTYIYYRRTSGCFDEHDESYYNLENCKFALLNSRLQVVSEYKYDSVEAINRTVCAKIKSNSSESSKLYKQVDIFYRGQFFSTYQNSDVKIINYTDYIRVYTPYRGSINQYVCDLKTGWKSQTYYYINVQNSMIYAFDKNGYIRYIDNHNESSAHKYLLLTKPVAGYMFGVVRHENLYDVVLVNINSIDDILVYTNQTSEDIIELLEFDKLRLEKIGGQLYVNSLKGALLNNKVLKEQKTNKALNSFYIPIKERTDSDWYWVSIWLNNEIRQMEDYGGPSYAELSKQADEDTWAAMNGY